MYVSHIIRTCLDHNRTNRNMCVLHRISWSFLLLRNINKNYGVEFVVYLALCVPTHRKCCCSYLNETVYFRLIFSIFQTRFLIILAFHHSSFIIVVRCFCNFVFPFLLFVVVNRIRCNKQKALWKTQSGDFNKNEMTNSTACRYINTHTHTHAPGQNTANHFIQKHIVEDSQYAPGQKQVDRQK